MPYEINGDVTVGRDITIGRDTTFSSFSGGGTQNLSVDNTGKIIAGSSTPLSQIINFSTSLTIDWSQGAYALINTLTDNFTINTPSNPEVGVTYRIRMVQDITAGRTVTWPSEFHFPRCAIQTLSTEANSVDVLELVYNGANYECVLNRGYA